MCLHDVSPRYRKDPTISFQEFSKKVRELFGKTVRFSDPVYDHVTRLENAYLENELLILKLFDWRNKRRYTSLSPVLVGDGRGSLSISPRTLIQISVTHPGCYYLAFLDCTNITIS
jgi:hypothetical protein